MKNMNTNTTEGAVETEHVFTKAGLGVAPFKLVGRYESVFQAAPGEPTKPGACCDFCFTAIRSCFKIRSADGREFKVDRWEAPNPRDRWTLREISPEGALRVTYHDTLRDAKVHIAARLYVGYQQSVHRSKITGYNRPEAVRDRVNPSRG